MAKSLGEAGHSHREAASPDELRQCLLSQRFDVLALKVRDEEEAGEIVQALEGASLPTHGILVGRTSALVGTASALELTRRFQRGGTFRYVPGSLTSRELTHLVDASIGAGTWEEYAAENGASSELEEVELEEIIEGAASAVYGSANRKRQRFNTVVAGPVSLVLGDPTKLRGTLVALLKLVVSLAPRGAAISIEAQAGREEWLIRIRASSSNRARRVPAQVAEALREETKTLSVVSRDLHGQGGMLWVELLGPAAWALCLTLPLPPETVRSASG
jgi:hypothetical protein